MEIKVPRRIEFKVDQPVSISDVVASLS